MRFKVEFDPNAVWFLRKRCDEATRKLFYEQFERIKEDPLSNSQVFSDRKKSRYVLRLFPFGGFVAIFAFDPSHDLIRVLECRLPK
jgi:mRNA-degrading endonuclease RelE of RelBE toxin-antitoxin system